PCELANCNHRHRRYVPTRRSSDLGWVAAGEARVWKMRSVLPSTSASCYASIHTGVTPQVHGVTGNDTIFRVAEPDIFSAVAAARSEEHTSELQSRENLVCRLLLEK